MVQKNPLLDATFLRDLYADRHKEIYAKIIALDKDENAIEEIEGQVTGGSVSLDGTSNVRRSCNLTIITHDIDINAYYWGFKNKFKLSVGLSNHVNQDYTNIIWFPMGTFVITSFNTALSTNSYTITISGKDKMCLLNGELSGSIFAMIDFGKEEVYDIRTKITTINDIPIKTIVREAVHEYASEPWENIVINDLDDIGLELLDYKGNMPLYLIIADNGSNEDLGDVSQITLNSHFPVYLPSGVATEISDSTNIVYNPRNNLDVGPDYGEPTHIKIAPEDEMTYTIAKVEYGQTCGYRYTDITYVGDLILNVGEPITSMLDKLVAMLGNWEYFYDVDGRFIFQRKKTYLDKTWNTIVTNNDDSYVPTMGETYAESALWSSAVSWNFTDGVLVTAFNNTPTLNNVRNDYSIWGTRQSISGAELPVHLRYAIDKKPTYYKTIEYDEDLKDEEDNIIGVRHHDSIEWCADGHLAEGIYIDGVYTNENFNDIKATLEERINAELNAKIANYKKTPNKVNLSEDWWDVTDWAEFYRLLAKEYPQGRLHDYANNGVASGELIPNLNDRIPEPQTGHYYYYGNTTITQSTPKYLYPTEIRGAFGKCTNEYLNREYNVLDVNEDGTLGYFGHMTSCSHTYTHFLNNAKYGITSYIYKPTIPEQQYKEFTEEELYEWISEHIIVKLPVNASPEDIEYYTSAGAQIQFIGLCDWRELIFQMAKDYRKHQHDDDFLLQVQNTNGLNAQGEWYYPGGKTGYEQYYTDLEGFWRQLYCPPQLLSQWYHTGVWTDRDQSGGFHQNNDSQVWNDVGLNPYSITSWSSSDGVTITLDNAARSNLNYYLSTDWVEHGTADKSGWNQQVVDSPATINFWFDFLSPDEDSDFARYSVPAIGDRTKSVNDNNVKAIYFREIPNTIFTEDIQNIERKSGYTYMQYQPTMGRLFNVSTQGKCAIDVLEEWLNNYVYAIESVNMTVVPIYHLQPNTRIKVMDMNSKINGDYIVSRISIPLNYNGTMSITATKVADRVY